MTVLAAAACLSPFLLHCALEVAAAAARPKVYDDLASAGPPAPPAPAPPPSPGPAGAVGEGKPGAG